MNRIARRLVTSSIFATGLWLGAATASGPAPEAADAPAAPVRVTNFGAKAPTTFDHGKHAGPELTCASCHHEGTGGQYRCGTCHLGEAGEKAPKIRDAMHGKDGGACFACHTRKDAPQKLKCADCHGS